MSSLTWYSKNASDGHNEQFNVKDGLVYTDNLSESLDSMIVIVPHITKRNFEPFDIIDVRGKFFQNRFIDEITMLIDSVSESQITFDEEPLFDYTLNLMSKTKELERVILPNFSISRRESGAQKTLKNVIEELLEDYSPKAFIDGEYKQIYRLGQGFDDLLNIECPEMQMSKPTLREALDKVFSVIKCICQLSKDNEIIPFEIDVKRNLIDLTGLNYQNENQSSSDYASELENTYNNVTPNKTQNTKNYTLSTEYVGFRNDSEALVNDNNISLILSKPIYLIKSVIGYFGTRGGSSTGVEQQFRIVDLTNYIFEQQAFLTLPAEGPLSEKASALYYTRGSNKISGWNDNAIGNKKQDLAAKIFNNPYAIPDWTVCCFFKVSYYAQEDKVKTQTNKYLPETHENNVIIDNPSDAYVDIKQQGTLFNQKVNRLGNRVKVLTGRYNSNNLRAIPKLGDYLDDFIIMNRELQYYDGFVVVKLTLTENFVNINYFTGINARRRSWQIVSQSEAFDKQLLEKWYCEFSFEEKIDLDNSGMQSAVSNKLSSYLLNSFYHDRNNLYPVWRSIIMTPHTVQQEGKASYLELEMSSYIAGDSLIFSFDINDNRIIGNSLDTNVSNYGWKQLPNIYTDENGENGYYHVMLLNDKYTAGYDYINLDLLNNLADLTNQQTAEQYLNLQSLSKFKPRLYIPDYEHLRQECVVFEFDYFNHKDNREKIGFNVQFQFCSDTPDIVIGNKFLEYNEAVMDVEYVGNQFFRLYCSPEKYRYGDNKLQEGSILLNPISPQNLGNIRITEIRQANSRLEIGMQEPISHKSFVITDNNDNIIIAVNTENYSTNVYLNLLKTRDRKHYLENSMKEWE